MNGNSNVAQRSTDCTAALCSERGSLWPAQGRAYGAERETERHWRSEEWERDDIRAKRGLTFICPPQVLNHHTSERAMRCVCGTERTSEAWALMCLIHTNQTLKWKCARMERAMIKTVSDYVCGVYLCVLKRNTVYRLMSAHLLHSQFPSYLPIPTPPEVPLSDWFTLTVRGLRMCSSATTGVTKPRGHTPRSACACKHACERRWSWGVTAFKRKLTVSFKRNQKRSNSH